MGTLTSDRRANQGGETLEQHLKSKGVIQHTNSKQIHQYDGPKGSKCRYKNIPLNSVTFMVIVM